MVTRRRNRWLDATPNGVVSEESRPRGWYAPEHRLRQITDRVEEIVATHPVVSLAVAVSAGMAFAWWMKRK